MAGSAQGGIPNVNQAAAQGIYGAGQGAAMEMGYIPNQVQAGQLATTDLSQYQNPYTQQVIDASAQDRPQAHLADLDMALHRRKWEEALPRCWGSNLHS